MEKQNTLDSFIPIIRPIRPKPKKVKSNEKKKYTQDWKAYDNAKTKEFILFKSFLKQIFDVYFKYETKTNKRIPTKDRILMMCLKVYFKSDFRKLKGIIEDLYGKAPSYKTLCNFFDDENIEQVLDDLILISSMPLSSLEKTGAIDSTGFSTSNFDNWNEFKWGKLKGKEQVWRKLHCVVGCHTNTIISAKVTEKNVADAPMVEPTLENKTKYFELENFVADKAYNSRKIFDYLRELGLDVFIPYKSNAVAKARGSYYWKKMFLYFRDHQDEFMEKYHKRSNVETTFSMLKTRFNNKVMTKRLISNINEIKIKCLCHNICVLIQEMFENKIEINFDKTMEKMKSV